MRKHEPMRKSLYYSNRLCTCSVFSSARWNDIVENEEKYRRILIWMEDSRPRKLTLGVKLRVDSVAQVTNQSPNLHLETEHGEKRAYGKNIVESMNMCMIMLCFYSIKYSTPNSPHVLIWMEDSRLRTLILGVTSFVESIVQNRTSRILHLETDN